MNSFKALFQSKNNDMIDAFYGTVICITTPEKGINYIWYLDNEGVLKCADATAYRITKVD
ncbi:MAG: hypothetical protein JWP69_2286 [Flaviaesturariibacter sp.]|nr:hypothetical protein [Flaviaesturariibacter sp.]